jgi:hypothetical protein
VSGDKRHPVSAVPSAYDALAHLGVRYNSSMAEIHRAALEAQRSGTLTTERAAAWARLRNAEKRLVADFFELQIDPSMFGEPAVAPPPPAPPEAIVPPIHPLTADEIAIAISVEAPEPMPLPKPGPAPRLEADLWQLLREGWRPPAVAHPVPPLGSLLDDE